MDEHKHHWLLEPFPENKQFAGICRDCGEERQFPITTHDSIRWDRHVSPEVNTINYVRRPR